MVQGDPLSSLLFGALIHKPLQELHAALEIHGGSAAAGADDVFAVGRPEHVVPAVEHFGRQLAALGLELSVGSAAEPCKCEIIGHRQETRETVDEMIRQRRLDDDDASEDQSRLHGFTPRVVEGFLCYGIPLGDDEYIQTVLQSKARTIADTIHKCVNLLGDGYKQDLWCLIRSSLQMNLKFSYWNQLCSHETWRGLKPPPSWTGRYGKPHARPWASTRMSWEPSKVRARPRTKEPSTSSRSSFPGPHSPSSATILPSHER